MGGSYRLSERAFDGLLHLYAAGLKIVLRHRFTTLMVMLAPSVLTGYLYVGYQGLFSPQDTDLIIGTVRGGAGHLLLPPWPSASRPLINAVLEDPAVGLDRIRDRRRRGTTTINNGRVFIALKPPDERDVTRDQIIRRLQTRLARIQGITLYMQAAQDITIGGRLSKTQYQYTWRMRPRRAQSLGAALLDKIKTFPRLPMSRPISKMPDRLLDITVNREVASSYGILPATIGQYARRCLRPTDRVDHVHDGQPVHVVMGSIQIPVRPRSAQRHLCQLIDRPTGAVETLVTSVVRISPLVVNHQGQFPSVTSHTTWRPVSSGRPSPHPAGRERARKTAFADHEFPGQCPGLPIVAGEHADPDRAARRHLSHSRHAHESTIHPITILSTLRPPALARCCCSWRFTST